MKKRLLPLLLLGGSVCAQEETTPVLPALPAAGAGQTISGETSPPASGVLPQYAPFPEEGVYWIQDGGRMKRKFQLSFDEVSVGSRSSDSIQSFGPAADGLDALRLAEELSLVTGKTVWPVFYAADEERTPENRRLLSNRLHLILEPGADIGQFCTELGAHTVELFEGSRDEYYLKFSSPAAVLYAANSLVGAPGVLYIEPCLTRKYVPLAQAAPNDNFFDASYAPLMKYEGHADNTVRDAYQWYLENTGLNYPANSFNSFYTYTADPAANFARTLLRTDIRARGAWEYTKGVNARINILDTGVNVAHPDLLPAKDVISQYHRDYIDDDGDVRPINGIGTWVGTAAGGSGHGTNVAGIMVAAHNNGGIIPTSGQKELAGVAPDANFIAQRIDDQIDEVDLVRAIYTGGSVLDTPSSFGGVNYTKITYTNTPAWDTMSWLLTVGGNAPAPLFYARNVLNAFETTLGKNRNKKTGMGAVLVTAGLNNGNYRGNNNWDEFRASGMPLVVGAVSDAGARVAYSARGSNIAVVAPGASTDSNIRDEMFPSLEPRLTPTSIAPQSLPPFIEYPANPFVPMPFTASDLPASQVHIQISGTQLRRAGQPIVSLGATQTPGYTRNFTGCSASGAMVSGVAALISSLRSDLGWMDIQEIIMRSAEINQAPQWWDAYTKEVDIGWRESPTGKPYSHYFGYGVVNAERAAEWARAWKKLNVPIIKDGSLAFENYPPREKFLRKITDPVIGDFLVWDSLEKFRGQSLLNSNIPRSLGPVPAGFRIQRILVKINAPTNAEATKVVRAPMGIRLIAPPERDAIVDVANRPTIISHLMFPTKEDRGAGLNFWTFSTMHHLGAVHSTGKNLLLHIYGANINDTYGLTDGLEVKYIGTRDSEPVNMPPAFEANRPTGVLTATLGMAIVSGERGNVYRQAAPVGTPPKWVRGNLLRTWFGGKVPADDANPADPDTPGFRRVRSPHVMKPSPLPVAVLPAFLDHASYPAPLDVPNTSGYVPLDEPRWRTRALGAPAGPWQPGMPPGIVFDPDTGVFSGAPSQQGKFQIELTATNMFDFAPAPSVPDPALPNHLLIRPGRKLLIDVTIRPPGAVESFQDWSQSFFPGINPSVSPDGDEDGDGYSNYWEYLAGSYPNTFDDSAERENKTPFYQEIVTSTVPAQIKYHWTQNTVSSEVFQLQSSTDMVTWNALPNPTASYVRSGVNGYDFVTTPVTGERRYYRLKAVPR